MRHSAAGLGFALAIMFTGLFTAPAHAQSAGSAVKIGVINDQSSIYADLSGMGGVEAARMAVEDFGGSVLGKPVELVFADHQNKPDIASNIVSKWFEVDNVDAVVDLPNSSAMLAVQEIARKAQKILIVSTGATTFQGFRKYVIDVASTRIYALLNISTIGLVVTNEIYLDPRMVDARAAIRTIGRS